MNSSVYNYIGLRWEWWSTQERHKFLYVGLYLLPVIESKQKWLHKVWLINTKVQTLTNVYTLELVANY